MAEAPAGRQRRLLKRERLRSAKGFTLVELLVVVGIIGLVAAIAVPGLLRARISGNEASAIGSLRAINSGEATFASSCAMGNYADTLPHLGLAPPGGTAFISPDLTGGGTVLKSGYNVTLAPLTGAIVTLVNPCNDTANAWTVSVYYAKAEPATLNVTGTRSFATDSHGTIFQNTTGTAPANAANGVVLTATDTPVQ